MFQSSIIGWVLVCPGDLLGSFLFSNSSLLPPLSPFPSLPPPYYYHQHQYSLFSFSVYLLSELGDAAILGSWLGSCSPGRSDGRGLEKGSWLLLHSDRSAYSRGRSVVNERKQTKMMKKERRKRERLIGWSRVEVEQLSPSLQKQPDTKRRCAVPFLRQPGGNGWGGEEEEERRSEMTMSTLRMTARLGVSRFWVDTLFTLVKQEDELEKECEGGKSVISSLCGKATCYLQCRNKESPPRPPPPLAVAVARVQSFCFSASAAGIPLSLSLFLFSFSSLSFPSFPSLLSFFLLSLFRLPLIFLACESIDQPKLPSFHCWIDLFFFPACLSFFRFILLSFPSSDVLFLPFPSLSLSLL